MRKVAHLNPVLRQRLRRAHGTRMFFGARGRVIWCMEGSVVPLSRLRRRSCRSLAVWRRAPFLLTCFWICVVHRRASSPYLCSHRPWHRKGSLARCQTFFIEPNGVYVNDWRAHTSVACASSSEYDCRLYLTALRRGSGTVRYLAAGAFSYPGWTETDSRRERPVSALNVVVSVTFSYPGWTKTDFCREGPCSALNVVFSGVLKLVSAATGFIST